MQNSNVMIEQPLTSDLIKQIEALMKKVEELEMIQDDPVKLVRTPKAASTETYIFNVSKKLAEKFVLYPQITTGNHYDKREFSVWRMGNCWVHHGNPHNMSVEDFLDSLKIPYTIFIHRHGNINHYLAQFDY